MSEADVNVFNGPNEFLDLRKRRGQRTAKAVVAARAAAAFGSRISRKRNQKLTKRAECPLAPLINLAACS